jgi:hypothetical protein
VIETRPYYLHISDRDTIILFTQSISMELYSKMLFRHDFKPVAKHEQRHTSSLEKNNHDVS